MTNLDREQLIDLMTRILTAAGTESELERLCALFDANVPHPNGSSLAFYPEADADEAKDVSAYDPSPEEVVDRALSYKPIPMPPSEETPE